MEGKILSIAVIMIALAPIVAAASLTGSPTACNGGWSGCNYAFADGGNYASFAPIKKANSISTWGNYGFNLSQGDSVSGVSVRADYWASRTNGRANIQVSNDGGMTWGQIHTIGGNTAQNAYNIDISNDFAWTPSMLSNGNFVVRANAYKSGNGGNPTSYLDWIPVTVQYQPNNFDFGINTSVPQMNISRGSNTSNNVYVSLVSGLPQSVSLSYSNCPPGATCGFAPISGFAPYLSVFTLQTTLNTTPGFYWINITGTGGAKSHSAQYFVFIG